MTWATDHLFVAGGDFVAEHWREFQDQAAVRAVVTVDDERPGTFLDPRPWAVLWLPVGEEAAYTLDQLVLGARFVDVALAAGHKVLLHAAKGVHRTRPLVAAHLVARGKSVARAVREVEQKPWLPPYKGDVGLLEQLVESYGHPLHRH